MVTLLTPPSSYSHAQRAGLPIAHAAYRVRKDGALLRAELPASLRGGVMVVSGALYEGGGNAQALARAILSECRAREFGAVLCDFEPPPDPVLYKTVEWLTRSGMTVVVHEGYARAARDGRVLIPTAVSGGTLHERLSTAAARYGAGRVVLAVERVREDFRLPAPGGRGETLTGQELESLTRRYNTTDFFSEALCARYFTYRVQNGAFHFVLFDDAESIAKKISVARTVGITRILLPYPEVEGILDRIMQE